MGAGLQGDDDLNGADVHSSADGSGDDGVVPQPEQQQTWTINKVPRKVKGQPKSNQAHRFPSSFFLETPAHFQRKKKARVATFLLPSVTK